MTATIAGVAAAVHAATPPAEKVTPGVLGFAVVFVLALATWLLLRSMVGHLRKVRYSPEPGAPRTGEAPAEENGDSGAEPSGSGTGEGPAEPA
ncbi:MAG TPA: hypothetical protein VFP72_24035 [Kineosporiaceae bacterium]|nr:hypothetical protein [Kineosporiaceae bacterium]